MLDYKYEHRQYYSWMYQLAGFAEKEYEIEIELISEENAFIYTYEKKKIQVKGTTPPRDKLYILLHEVGHVARMIENREDNTYFMDRNGSKNMVEKTMTLMEEVLAWHKAELIAQKLNITIEKRAWQRLVNKSVQKYADWTFAPVEHNKKENI